MGYIGLKIFTGILLLIAVVLTFGNLVTFGSNLESGASANSSHNAGPLFFKAAFIISIPVFLAAAFFIIRFIVINIKLCFRSMKE